MAAPAAPSPAELRATLRQILRIVNREYTARNANRLWSRGVTDLFRAAPGLATHPHGARNLLAFLHGHNEHRRLFELYWPNSLLSNEEKLRRTVNTVGLAMPGTLDDRIAQGEERREREIARYKEMEADKADQLLSQAKPSASS
ncbi:hypothetical protein CXG81DRAFT_25985 [Caulochytrium protostelioides]|uniref:Uncharacterized protein n=1 Tax=Caulochytrium protostelioides TaxID=1555241 RepID=A0A4P9X7U4_9FUNG|nr:hypothetical protein CXG81DRAFT_25985 [Caulochytrium protostelioides]|eukprot:RKP01326.1 hypothetical protein CXG81DRAFT_25985 [Caulochytrium protostelioides]